MIATYKEYMVNTCVVAFCKTGYQKRQHTIHVIPEKFLVFRFPLKNPELNRKWIRFVFFFPEGDKVCE